MSTHDWPDPDDVRNGLAVSWIHRPMREASVVDQAAHAYLRMREEHANCACAKFGMCAYHGMLMVTRHQPAEPALTIEQVIAACGEDVTGVSLWKLEDGTWGIVFGSTPTQLPPANAIADTPEAAIQQLGRDAIAKIKERHAADAAKLKELGVEP